MSSAKLADVREEIGDVMIYLTELAEKLGIDPVEAAKVKLEINNRKYPATLVRGKLTSTRSMSRRDIQRLSQAKTCSLCHNTTLHHCRL